MVKNLVDQVNERELLVKDLKATIYELTKNDTGNCVKAKFDSTIYKKFRNQEIKDLKRSIY